MSNIEYTPGHWTTDSVLFTTHGKKQGLLAVREGKMFGAQSAYALLGPDLAMTGGRTNNPPNATGPCWDNIWSVGVPAAYFTQDGNNTWVRAHLINGEWHGSGVKWNNLVPMTSGGNANHKSVEARMKTYLQNFRAFERSANRAYWYALRYWVQVSTDPWAANPTPGDLYSYAPNMIKVTWRIVTVQKPAPNTWNSAQAAINGAPNWITNAATGPPNNIALDLPNLPANNIPAVLVNNPMNAAGIGGGVYAVPAGAPGIPGAGGHGFDGTVEIMQD